MIGLHLLLFAGVVSVSAPPVLRRAGWVYRSPRLGIAAWYAVLLAVVSAVAVAVASWVAPWQGAGAPVCMMWRWCLQAVQGGFGIPGRLGAVIVAIIGVGLAVRLATTAWKVGRAASAMRNRHRQMLTLAARTAPELGASVVDHPQPAAYVVGGRHRRVVVTTGAVDALTGLELAAVLAHERAHAAGRHDLLLDAVRLLEKAFPRVLLFAVARSELCRLVEMRADDVATAHHAPVTLARAMVTMATAGSSTWTATPVLAGAVAATGGDALERLHRLLSPPPRLSRARGVAIGAGVAALALLPAVFAVAAQFLPMLGACPPVPFMPS